MNDLAEKITQSLTATECVDEMEKFMLELPQAECPVYHHFGPGIYVREVHLPKGIFAIGHAQKYEHLNIVLKGTVLMTGDDGSLKEIRAPMIFTGKPGRKFGYVIEDVIWLNIYATEETDIDKLESHYLDKSDYSLKKYSSERDLKYLANEIDREDFRKVIELAGFTEEMVREQSENTDDQIPMPDGYSIITVRDSDIEGKGIFVSAPVRKGQFIGLARLSGKRTPIGRYVNHSVFPNAEYIKTENGDIYAIAIRDINGCIGGSQGDEITVDYRQALALSGIKLRGES